MYTGRKQQGPRGNQGNSSITTTMSLLLRKKIFNSTIFFPGNKNARYRLVVMFNYFVGYLHKEEESSKGWGPAYQCNSRLQHSTATSTLIHMGIRGELQVPKSGDSNSSIQERESCTILPAQFKQVSDVLYMYI